ncbi:MAG: hypothetical protein ACLTSG_07310 [Lachnospiraceae bacterium]
MAAIFFIVRFPPGDWVLDNPLPYGEGGVPPGRKLAVAGATVCLMFGHECSWATPSPSSCTRGAASASRASCLPVRRGPSLLFGFVADIKKRALPSSTMAACSARGLQR